MVARVGAYTCTSLLDGIDHLFALALSRQLARHPIEAVPMCEELSHVKYGLPGAMV